MGMFANRSRFGIEDLAPLSPASGTMPSFAPTPQIAPPKPSFFGDGGVGRGIAGSIGDALLALNHQAPIYAPAMQEQRQERRQSALFQAQQARLNRPQIINTGDGEVVAVDPATQGISVLQPARPPLPRQPAIQQQVEYIRSLDPTITDTQAADIAERALSGYAFSPEARQGKVADQIAVADHRAGNSAALKATPTYSQAHPSAGGGGKISATRSIGGKVYRKIAGRWYED